MASSAITAPSGLPFAPAVFGVNGRLKQYTPSDGWLTFASLMPLEGEPVSIVPSASISAYARGAPIFAFFTDRPGARWVIRLLAIFLTCFFCALLRRFAATPVPTSVRLKARAATMIAADGR